jgi:hypothetical protein
MSGYNKQYQIDNLTLQELRWAIASMSYERDDLLKAKGLNPHEIRVQFNKQRNHEQELKRYGPLEYHGEIFNGRYVKKIDEWLEAQSKQNSLVFEWESRIDKEVEPFCTCCDPGPDIIYEYIEFHLSPTNKIEFGMFHLKVAPSDYLSNDDSYCGISNPATHQCPYDLEKLLRINTKLIEELGDHFGYKFLLSSLPTP